MAAFAVNLERRSFGRRKASTAGLIELPLRPLLECRVLDISQAGAMLEVGCREWLPSKFRLIVGVAKYDCVVRHRDGAIVGVSFVF